MSKFRKFAFPALIVLLLVALAAALVIGRQLVRVAAGFSAKVACSSVHVSRREWSSILEQDLSNFGWLRIERGDTHVEASLLGVWKRRAEFVPGRGCTLIDGSPLAKPEANASLGAPAELEQGERIPALETVVARAFDEPDPKNNLLRTRAVVVLHRGKIVAERYATGFTPETPLLGWSMAKGVTATLVGILIGEGKLRLDQPAPVPEWANTPRAKITIADLLRMSSGLEFSERYDWPFSDALQMLFVVPGAGSFAARADLGAKPGTVWAYSSGTSNILSRIIHDVARRTPGAGDPLTFARRALFEPLGMQSALIESDAEGVMVGSSFMYATARDWARFGQLYLQEGAWQGRQLLSREWLAFVREPAPAVAKKNYGGHFWLNRDSRIPHDVFYSAGHEGQFVHVVPSREAVVVRLGLTFKSKGWDDKGFVADVLAALSSR